MTRTRLWLLTAAALLITGGLYAALETTVPAPDLATWAPSGALLSIESPDFSTLLHDWTASPEAAAWLHSDNYAEFSNSHLFGRLQDAQTQFATAAGLPVDTALLKQLAGRQTFFAWYDIGDLQLLYITRLPPGTASKNPLLTHRSQFQTRQSGGITFYVKTTTANDADTTPTDTADDAPDDTTTSPTHQSRTVAFAVSGDYLILATGEDLLAHTLELLAQSTKSSAQPQSTAERAASGTLAPQDLAHQPWYQEAHAPAPTQPGELRMTLHLEAIAKTPQFRSYWIQRNITETSHYAASVSDLYRDATGLREERILLPKPTTDATPSQTDLTQLTAFVPAHTAIYRAAAYPTAADILTTLNEKLLAHTLSTNADITLAPTTDLATPQPGTTTDLESRIDDPIAPTSATDTTPLLRTLLSKQPIDAQMTLDRNDAHNSARSPNISIWTPFASAVLLHSQQPWNPTTLQQALTQAIEQHLTTSSLGLTWQQHAAAGQTYFTTSQAAPLLLAIHGQTCILTDDEPLLLDILQTLQHPPTTKPQPALLLAGFDHTSAQPAFSQWTATIDGLHQSSPATQPTTPQPESQTDPTHTPAFFAENLQSLSQTFTHMTHETFTAYQEGNLLHQTVRYTFTH